MSEILSADEILDWYAGLGWPPEALNEGARVYRSHEALRARVRDLEAALDELAHWRGCMHGEAKRMRERARAALRAVPQPARCPTCSDEAKAKRGGHVLATACGDPWHREAHSG